MFRCIGGRRRGERGAAIVEMAILAPVLVLLVFGAIEMGLAFKDRHTVSSAANSAGRTGATAGQDDVADYAILQAVEAAFGSQVDPDVIVHVDIYSAGVDGSKGAYNRYTYDGDPVCPWVPCPDPANFEGYGSPSNWAPDTRDTTLDGDGLDTLGIEIQYTHAWVTNILGLGPQTWTEDAQVRLEPDLLGN
jgi:hypothetical protein